MLKNEIKRAIYNKGMLLSLMIGHFISLYYWIGIYKKRADKLRLLEELYTQGMELYQYQVEDTPFSGWMFSHANKECAMFFYLLPLLAALPFAASYWKEKRTGYEKNILIRTTRTKYRWNKYIATFIAGGLSVSSVCITNLMMAFAYIRYRTPTPSSITKMTWAVTQLGAYYYEHPFVYCGIYIVAIFVLAGAIATLSLLISTFWNNYFTVMLIPFMFYILIQAFVEDEYQIYLPSSCFYPANSGVGFFMVPIICGTLLLVSFIGFVVSSKNKDCL